MNLGSWVNIGGFDSEGDALGPYAWQRPDGSFVGGYTPEGTWVYGQLQYNPHAPEPFTGFEIWNGGPDQIARLSAMVGDEAIGASQEQFKIWFDAAIQLAREAAYPQLRPQSEFMGIAMDFFQPIAVMATAVIGAGVFGPGAGAAGELSPGAAASFDLPGVSSGGFVGGELSPGAVASFDLPGVSSGGYVPDLVYPDVAIPEIGQDFLPENLTYPDVQVPEIGTPSGSGFPDVSNIPSVPQAPAASLNPPIKLPATLPLNSAPGMMEALTKGLGPLGTMTKAAGTLMSLYTVVGGALVRKPTATLPRYAPDGVTPYMIDSGTPGVAANWSPVLKDLALPAAILAGVFLLTRG